MNIKTQWGIGWVLAFLGFPLGGLLTSILLGRMDNPLEAIIGGGLAGAVIGLAQYLALVRWLPVDWRWIAATAAGIGLGLGLSAALVGTATTLEAVVLRAPLTGLLLGVAQGFLLQGHLRPAWVWVLALPLIYTLAWFITAQVIGASLDEGFYVFGASGAISFQLLTGVVLWWLGRSPSEGMA
jgi:hypothetical protein